MLPYYIGHHAGTDCDPREVLLLTLMDVWALTSDKLTPLRIASWVPVDHDPLPPRVLEFFARTGATPIAMSKFGQRALQDRGLDALYVPHGVDTNQMRPLNRTEVREAAGIPDDSFVIGMVANNKGQAPPRKAFPQVFQAFAEFHRQHPDTFLYLHSEMFGVDSGLNLIALAEICGVPQDAMIATDQLSMHLGIPADDMAAIYNGMDVLACPSYGEGFGIPIVEAQSCGVPVIVTNWTAMPELVGAGWLVEGDTWYDPPHGSFYKNPSIYDILEAFRAAYETANTMGAAAREFALGYDVDRVMNELWVPVLEEIEKPREVAPLGNRAQRRAAKKAAA
jgi:glycosyltransferase involved in cell wall biosynthesis